MEKQIKLFLDFLKVDKKLSENTLQSYKRDIEQYEKYWAPAKVAQYIIDSVKNK